MEEISPFKHPPFLPLIEFPEYLFYLYRHIRFICCVMKNISSVKKWQYSHSVMKSKICREQMRLHTINYPAPTCGKWLSSSSNASSPIGLLKNKSCWKKNTLVKRLFNKTCCSLTLMLQLMQQTLTDNYFHRNFLDPTPTEML